jgi:hypothetical protein
MMTWKLSSLRGLREVGSAKERFCFFGMPAASERGGRRKGRSDVLRGAYFAAFCMLEVADADHLKVAAGRWNGGFCAAHFGK